MLMHVARDLPCGVILISGLLGLSMLDRHPATTQPHLPDSRVQRGSAVISDGVATGPPFWLPVAPMSTPRSDLAATLGPDERIYALGGFNAVGKYLKTAEAYDEQAGTWTPIASMAVSRSTFDAVTGSDGRIYAISGYTGVTYTRAVEAYTPHLNRWIAVADTVLPHPGSGAVAGPDGRIYVMGANDGQGMGAVEVYSPGDDRWTRLGDLIGGRGDFGVARGPDGRLYAIGGSPGSIYDLAVAEDYNVHTAHWTSLANMPTARRALAAATGADGRIYAIGGGTAEGGPLATVEAYDVRTGRWSRVASLHTPRRGLKAVRGTDSRLYALGGAGGGPPSAARGTPINPSDYLRVVEVYGPLLHTTPHRAAAGSSVVLTGTNFAASATVTVTWGGTPQGVALVTGQTDRAGALRQSLRFHIPAGTRPGQYVVTAIDDRSRYPVTASVTVGVSASDGGLPPTPRPLSTPADPVRAACCGGRFFPQSGHSLSGPFLAYYQRYGGLDTFGYPRTEPFTDTGHLEQYTDRALLQQVGGQVRPAPLGYLLTQGRVFPTIAAFPSTPTRRYFPATRHSLSGAFLAYWRAHHGATLLGAPLAEPTREQNGDGSGRAYLVQWCENGRLEYHPEQKDSRYQVQLGLVGKQALQQRGWLP